VTAGIQHFAPVLSFYGSPAWRMNPSDRMEDLDAEASPVFLFLFFSSTTTLPIVAMSRPNVNLTHLSYCWRLSGALTSASQHLCYDLINLNHTSFMYSKDSILLCFMLHMLGFNTPYAIQLYLFCTALLSLHSDYML